MIDRFGKTMVRLLHRITVPLLLIAGAWCLISGCSIHKDQEAKTIAVDAVNHVMPPVADRVPFVRSLHGEEHVDPYHWLSNPEDSRVLDYLRAENCFTEAMTEHTNELQETLYREMLAKWDTVDVPTPYRWGNYEYYSRMEEGKSYRTTYRRHLDGNSVEELVLDQNRLAKGSDFFDLGTFKMRPDHQLLLYTVDRIGNERYTVHFHSLGNEPSYAETISDTVAGGAHWGPDGSSVYYTRFDENDRMGCIYRHVLGTEPQEDQRIYVEPDPQAHCWLVRSRCGRFLFLGISTPKTQEWRYLDGLDPDPVFRTLVPRNEVRAQVAYGGNRFFVLTNQGNADNFRIRSTLVADGVALEEWEDVVPHRRNVLIEGMDLFADHLVVWERCDGRSQLRVMHLSTGDEHCVGLPGDVHTILRSANMEFNSDRFRFVYTSFDTPLTTFEYDMHTRELTMLTQQQVPGDFNASEYQTERRLVDVSGGCKVPVSLFYRKGCSSRRQERGSPPWLRQLRRKSGPLFQPGPAATHRSRSDLRNCARAGRR